MPPDPRVSPARPAVATVPAVCSHGFAHLSSGYSSCVHCAPHPPACVCNRPAPCLLQGAPTPEREVSP
jgi:hypothetical protein